MLKHSRIIRIASAPLIAGLFSMTATVVSSAPAGATKSVVNTLKIGTNPNDIEASGNNLWIANKGDNTVQEMDATTGEILKTITIANSDGSQPDDIAVDDSHLWLTFYGSAVVAEIDPVAGTVIKTIPVGNSADGVTSNGTFVWVANSGDDSITKIDAATGNVLSKIGLDPASAPDEMVLAGDNLAVTLGNSGKVALINKISDAVVSSSPVGSGPDGICTDGNNLWIANEFDGTVTQLKASDGSLVDTITVGATPKDIACGAGEVWVVNSDDNTVSEIDAATGTVVATYSVGAGPSAVAVANASAWVTNKDDSSVSQISEPSLITTAAAAPALATTGSSLAVPLGIVGILALAGGLGLMLLARRSSRSSR